MIILIYCAENKTNGKKYIGQDVRRKYKHNRPKSLRKNVHLNNAKSGRNTCPIFYNALRKQPDQSLWEWSIIGICDSQSKANDLEIKAIARHSLYPLGYNYHPGGGLTDGSQLHTPEARKKAESTRRRNYALGKWVPYNKGNRDPNAAKNQPRRKGQTLIEFYSTQQTKRNTTQHKCPHCGKEGQSPSMYRWHFDKCKYAI